MKEQEMSSAEVEGRRNMLKAEKELLDTVKQRAIEELRSAPGPKKEQIISGLVRQASAAIPGGFVYSNAEDADFVKRAASRYQYAGSVDCIGGIIIESQDREQRLDLTYETILEDLWQEKIGEVADILFK